MEPDQPRLGASVMTHNYRRGRNQTSPGILQAAEPTRLLKISSRPKPNHHPKADKVLKFRTPLAQRTLTQKKLWGFYQASVSTQAPDHQTPPPSRITLQWPAEQPPGEKVRRSTRSLLSTPRIPSKNSSLDLDR